jgi:hypothetical protein
MTIKEFLSQGKFVYDPDFQYIFLVLPNNESIVIANVRGWGRIKNMFTTNEEAAVFQDNLGKFITEAIQEKLERL